MSGFVFRPLSTLVVLLGLAVLVGLGTWQMDRRAWKHDVLARIEAARIAPPLTLEALDRHIAAKAAGDGAAPFRPFEYRTIEVGGRFVGRRALHLPLRFHDNRLGVEIVVPFRADDGTLLMVNRGWLPLDDGGISAGPRATRAYAESPPLVLKGVLRLPSPPAPFTPDNAVNDNLWYSMDLAAMAAATGVSLAEDGRLRPFYLEAVEDGPQGLPIGGRTRWEFPDNHLQYAVTWYGLAATGLVIFLLASRRGKKASSR